MTYYTNPNQRVGLEQSGSHHYLIDNYFALAMIYLKNCWVKQQLLTHTIIHKLAGLNSIHPTNLQL